MDATNEQASDARVARREEWRQVLAEQAASGKTAAAFCQERGVPVWKFHYWRKALSTREAAADVSGFVQVKMAAVQAPGTQVWVEAGAWRVCVTPGFDEATLQRVLAAVTRA